jgi:hypothetical protein
MISSGLSRTKVSELFNPTLNLNLSTSQAFKTPIRLAYPVPSSGHQEPMNLFGKNFEVADMLGIKNIPTNGRPLQEIDTRLEGTAIHSVNNS